MACWRNLAEMARDLRMPASPTDDRAVLAEIRMARMAALAARWRQAWELEQKRAMEEQHALD
jgi:hypothetical protein